MVPQAAMIRVPDGQSVSLADRQYLRRPSPTDPWVPAIEMTLGDPPEVSDLEAAVRKALRAAPRFGSTMVGGGRRLRWEPGDRPGAVDAAGDEGEDEWRSRVIDRMFGADDFPLRVSAMGSLILVAWRHAVSDAAGGVGFCSLLCRALHGETIPEPELDAHRRTTRRVWQAAATPSAIGAFASKVRSFGAEPHAELEAVRPVGPESVARIARVSPPSPRPRVGFTGRVVAASVAACRELMPDGSPVTVLLPVNLRPDEKWFPAGNFVGNVEIAFGSAPDPSSATAEVERSRGPERYSAWWASAVREALPAGLGRRGESETGRLERSVVVNNLGRVDAGLFPGCESVVFHGPTAVDFPSISLVGLDDEVSLCVRVRVHQGGGDVASEILDRVVNDLSARAD